MKFFQHLKEEVKKYTDKKMHLVLDNHAAHKSVKHGTRAFLEANFELHWQPAGTPQVNVVEHLWSSYKRRFKKVLMVNPEMKWT